MKRSLLSSILLLALAIPGGAAAQTAADVGPQIQNQLGSDVKSIVLNMPVWMASHVPAMMPWSGNGAGIDMDRDGGDFSIGLNLAKIGVMNQFSSVGAGTQLVDLESLLPGVFPWPQFGINLGLSLGAGFEIGADIMFLPELDLNPADGLTVNAEFFQAAVGIGWRINKPDGALPTFFLSASGSIYHGNLEVGVNHRAPYSYDSVVDVPGSGPQTVTTEGEWQFDGGPDFNWTFYQVNVELRMAWDLEVFRPYFGLGVGFTFGEASSGALFSAQASIDRVAGQPTSGTEGFAEQVNYSTPAAQYLFRPLLGFDIVAGIVAINLQLELSLIQHDNLNTNVGDAADSLDPTQDVPFNKAREATTAAAFVGSLGLRFQF